MFYFNSKYKFKKFFLDKRYKNLEKGYSYFIEAMIAVSNKENKKANLLNKKMQSYLKNNKILTLLLQSEVSKMDNEVGKLQSVYEEMIKTKNTESLGYKGLMEQYLKNQDYHHAYIYGEKLFIINPKLEKLYETLIYVIAKTKNWNKMIELSARALSQKIIDKKTYNENQSIAYFEIAKIKRLSEPNESLKLIEKSLKLKSNFPPYIELYLEIVNSLGSISLLKKSLNKFWFENPSSLLRNVIVNFIEKNKIDNIDFIQEIARKNLSHEESKKLLVYLYIRTNKWDLARSNIKGIIGSNPGKEVCLFMAEIEEGEFNDIQKGDSWRLRAQNASLDNLWICKITNQPQSNWDSMSESGYFNSLEWKQPKMLNQPMEII